MNELIIQRLNTCKPGPVLFVQLMSSAYERLPGESRGERLKAWARTFMGEDGAAIRVLPETGLAIRGGGQFALDLFERC